jgi:hypothetical protein
MQFHKLERGNQMKKTLMAGILGTLISCVALPAMADNLVKFSGGIGSQPAAIGPDGKPSVVNDVFGIPPGGRPWVIESLKAQVKEDGRLSVRGEGLVLAGGNSIGTRGGIAQVVATLFCNGTAFTSAPVPISMDGDFEISDRLQNVPNPCLSPVLLIRNGAGVTPGPWFAAGIPKP